MKLYADDATVYINYYILIILMKILHMMLLAKT